LRPPLLFWLATWLRKRWGLLFVTLATLAVRLVWNLRIHRLRDFAYSDMAGYLDRAHFMTDKPDLKGPWLALYPYGTHFFIYAVNVVFGRNNDTAVEVAYAVVGALAVAYTYATAEIYVTRRWARVVIGLVLITYYPWISFGGYALSEMPFTLCLAGAAYHGLRLADRGRRRDAWWLGVFLAAGIAVRPQMLLAVVFLAAHHVLRRSTWRGFTATHLVRVGLPIAIILAASAWRLHDHMGYYGLGATNGPLNFVFGRCHNTGLEAVAPDSRGFFGPPSLAALGAHQKQDKHAIMRLDPVFGEKLTIQGHMWDPAPNYEMAARCVRKTGLLGQVRFALTHVVLLWGYNIPWPDQGQKPTWQRPMLIWCDAHNIVLLAPAAVAMLLAFTRRRARSMLLALHVWGVVLMAMLYFGDTRYRTPYDGLIALLALQTYVEIAPWLRRGWERVRYGRTIGMPSTLT
jgi:hypothetical protein